MHLSSQATQQVEIQRIPVPGQPGQKNFMTSHVNGKKAGHSDAYLAMVESFNWRFTILPGQKVRICPQSNKSKKG
jgi:hypothetical protein